MSCIVAIETSTEYCSVALMQGGALQTLRAIGVRQHAESVLPMLSRLLAEAGLARSAIDVIGYGRGPGAFTGVRLAVAVAQGLGFALDRPTFGVSSLQACASSAARLIPMPVKSQVIAILDARMGEFYVAAYQCGAPGAPVLMRQECLLTPNALKDWLHTHDTAPYAFAGSGLSGLSVLPADVLAGYPDARFFPEVMPDAEEIATLTALGFMANQAVPARQAQPIYVRDKVADTMIERAAKRAAIGLSATV